MTKTECLKLTGQKYELILQFKFKMDLICSESVALVFAK